MGRKRHSMIQRIFLILIGALVLNFLGGCFVLYKLEQSNTRYIYQMTRELMNTSIAEMEQQMDEIQLVLYDIIVSSEVQKAGSVLLAHKEQRTRSDLERVVGMNEIIDRIQKGISSNHSIVCANFLDDAGTVRTVSATRHYKLTEEEALKINERAVVAKGETIYLKSSDQTLQDNVLILAKEVREKRGLSLKHIGVVVLFIDLDRMGRLLTNVHDGIFVLENADNALQYILNDKDRLLEKYQIPEFPEKSYQVESLGDKLYFVVSFQKEGRHFSYIVLTPYEELFTGFWKTFASYVGLFILCGAAVTLLSSVFTNRVMKDIRQFICHIRRIPSKDSAKIPLYEETGILDKDVYALQTAFNAMSMRINELVRDNYTKQLLIKETQVQALQAQMNPHFLYNTLNSVYWMANTAGMTSAAEMISSLGILIREAISDEEFAITVEKELDIVCQYFIIQKHRYEDRLIVKFDISEECSDFIIPKFTIQPLVENAIAYGLECILEPCTVKVILFTEEEDFICQIHNNGPEPDGELIKKLCEKTLKPKGNGIGLLNINQRIKCLFGEEYGVTVFRNGEQTVAQVRMKGVTMEDYKEGGRDG